MGLKYGGLEYEGLEFLAMVDYLLLFPYAHKIFRLYFVDGHRLAQVVFYFSHRYFFGRFKIDFFDVGSIITKEFVFVADRCTFHESQNHFLGFLFVIDVAQQPVFTVKWAIPFDAFLYGFHRFKNYIAQNF